MGNNISARYICNNKNALFLLIPGPGNYCQGDCLALRFALYFIVIEPAFSASSGMGIPSPLIFLQLVILAFWFNLWFHLYFLPCSKWAHPVYKKNNFFLPKPFTKVLTFQPRKSRISMCVYCVWLIKKQLLTMLCIFVAFKLSPQQPVCAVYESQNPDFSGIFVWSWSWNI